MHIIYAAATCSDAVYRKLFSNTAKKPAFQSQKYNRLLIEGLAHGAQVDVVANPPVNRTLMAVPRITLPEETAGGAVYHYVDAYRHPVRKLIHVLAGTFWKTFRLARKDSVVIVDCLCATSGVAALLAAKLRGCACTGIVTDLPDMLHSGGLFRKISNYVISRCTHYVVLTQDMNAYVNKKGRPYLVLEGHADITMRDKLPSMESKVHPRICMYAGSISKIYGLQALVQGFQMAAIPDAQLHIYGAGDYVEELRRIAEQDPRVYYGGMLLSGDVVPKEMEATLLVNPRPTNEEYVKYSFPSKTMEYMSTGTPVLTTRLPGIPEEYKEHLYFIEEESAQGIAEAMKTALQHTDAELFEKGCAAREFVLNERNNVVQADKILKMLYQKG